jgi:hypothetical protein
MGLGTISFVQEPNQASDKLPVLTEFTPLTPYTVYQNDISSLFYFKLILEVRLDDASGTLLGKIKQRRNGYAADVAADEARAIFDLKDIVGSQLEDTIYDYGSVVSSIHRITNYSKNTNQLKTIYVKAYQEFSSAANISPTEDTSTTVNSTRFYIAASFNASIGAGGLLQYAQGIQMSLYIPKSGAGLLLSDVFYTDAGMVGGVNLGSVVRNHVRTGDYHTLAFINGETDFAAVLRYMQVKFYNGASEESSTNVENSDANGGAKPETSGGEVDTDAERLIYFGCGPAQLTKPTDWTHYTIQGLNAATTAVTPLYYFIKDDDNCKGFTISRLAWRNTFGCYDYFNFKMKNTQTIEVERNNYETLVGEFNNTMYGYSQLSRGKKTRNITTRVKETINTDWLQEEDAILLQGLLSSTNVVILRGSFSHPVIITDSSMVRKTVANDRLKIQYTLKIEWAVPINQINWQTNVTMIS